MGQFVNLTSSDGVVVPAWVAQPDVAPCGAVVVLQEIFGVNSHIRAVADRFAARGYLAVAPATFHRVQPDVELGYTGDDMQAGMGLKAAVEALPAPGVMPDIQAAIDYAAAQSGRKVGIVGFCWGGLLTWRAACTLTGLSAAVPYYGGGMTSADEAARVPKVPVLAHFGQRDHYIPVDSVQAFARAHPEVEVHLYEADHGFNCDQRGSYDEASAMLARDRTLAFFDKHLMA
ncbi:dienelactone hydrolase family protein [Acidovorax sp. LjRoot117]|uniref:dienelactone hydrolase family protein n=1 Tax=Acidovorax sp. LjRoot117 TaxID=3342255 RepID=UPI003ED0B1DD